MDNIFHHSAKQSLHVRPGFFQVCADPESEPATLHELPTWLLSLLSLQAKQQGTQWLRKFRQMSLVAGFAEVGSVEYTAVCTASNMQEADRLLFRIVASPAAIKDAKGEVTSTEPSGST